MLAKDLRYTLDEFYALPEGTRAELINGILYDMSPAPSTFHQDISSALLAEIFMYIKKNKGSCKVYSAPFDVQLSQNTVVQPDISVICDRNKLTSKRCVGTPDWIIEITSSNSAHDYFTKLNLYRDYGVKEYWIVDTKTHSVNVWLFFEDNSFDMNAYTFDESITVNLYKDKPEPLQITISELLL